MVQKILTYYYNYYRKKKKCTQIVKKIAYHNMIQIQYIFTKFRKRNNITIYKNNNTKKLINGKKI